MLNWDIEGKDKTNAKGIKPDAEKKKLDLFIQQKQTLDLFLEHGAITQAQYNKSLGDLKEKMGIEELLKAGED